MLVEKDREIEKLRTHLINAAKARFGKKSEKLPSSSFIQETIFPVEELSEEAESSPTIEVPAHTRAVKRKQREIPEGTPVTVINHAPAETACGCCGSELVKLRTEITKTTAKDGRVAGNSPRSASGMGP